MFFLNSILIKWSWHNCIPFLDQTNALMQTCSSLLREEFCKCTWVKELYKILGWTHSCHLQNILLASKFEFKLIFAAELQTAATSNFQVAVDKGSKTFTRLAMSGTQTTSACRTYLASQQHLLWRCFARSRALKSPPHTTLFCMAESAFHLHHASQLRQPLSSYLLRWRLVLSTVSAPRRFLRHKHVSHNC